MNRLRVEEQVAIVHSLVEGNSIRATCRITGAAKGTVLSLLARIGQVCAKYQDKTLRNLPCTRIQCDEIWSFCYAKQKNVPERYQGKFGYGHVWTFTALCADTKLIPCWRVGWRDAINAELFMLDLAKRCPNRLHLTTDAFQGYPEAVRYAFGEEVDYAVLTKVFGQPERSPDHKYSKPPIVGVSAERIIGRPNHLLVSTSYVERANLTMRMGMRRFTRVTNAFSKKVDNLKFAVALHMFHYNFSRVHQTTKKTPAMAAGVSDKIWKIEDIVLLGERN